MNHNTLSTSTLASPAIEGGAFGPVSRTPNCLANPSGVHRGLTRKLAPSSFWWRWGAGQVVPDGYGVGYGMEGNYMRFVVSSYLKVAPFLGALEQSLADMRKALVEGGPVPEKGDAPRKRR